MVLVSTACVLRMQAAGMLERPLAWPHFLGWPPVSEACAAQAGGQDAGAAAGVAPLLWLATFILRRVLRMQAAEMLERPLAWPHFRRLREDPAALKAALREFSGAQGSLAQRLPLMSELEAAGREDLIKAIHALGVSHSFCDWPAPSACKSSLVEARLAQDSLCACEARAGFVCVCT